MFSLVDRRWAILFFTILRGDTFKLTSARTSSSFTFYKHLNPTLPESSISSLISLKLVPKTGKWAASLEFYTKVFDGNGGRIFDFVLNMVEIVEALSLRVTHFLIAIEFLLSLFQRKVLFYSVLAPFCCSLRHLCSWLVAFPYSVYKNLDGVYVYNPNTWFAEYVNYNEETFNRIVKHKRWVRLLPRPLCIFNVFFSFKEFTLWKRWSNFKSLSTSIISKFQLLPGV